MITATVPTHSWSSFQTDIYTFVRSDTRSAIVEAAAGSGKTSTLVEAARQLSEWDNAAAIAFNVKIKDELVKRLPPFVPAFTLNSLGFRAWKAHVGKSMEVDGRKVSGLVQKLGTFTNPDYRKGLKRLVDLAKLSGIVPGTVRTETFPLIDDADENWLSLIDEYGIFLGPGDYTKQAIDDGRTVLAASIQSAGTLIDFNDQLYLPVIFQADFPQYDILFIDEAQDVSAIQRVMIERSVKVGGRIIAFGDSSQGIYQFRGAGKDSLGALKRHFDAVSFPLSISYRCSKAVVRKAQQFDPKIQAWEGAPEGLVDENAVWTVEAFQPTDVILCRNNAPLVKMAFRLLRAGKACKVMGRDIGSGLVAIIQRFKVTTMVELRERVNRYFQNEISKVQTDPDAMLTIMDKRDTLSIFMENARTPVGVMQKIKSLFEDEKGQYLMLSTVHKAKGLEWPRVWVLDPELIGARGPEPNLQYVACTRAQNELRFIRSDG